MIDLQVCVYMCIQKMKIIRLVEEARRGGGGGGREGRRSISDEECWNFERRPLDGYPTWPLSADLAWLLYPRWTVTSPRLNSTK